MSRRYGDSAPEALDQRILKKTKNGSWSFLLDIPGQMDQLIREYSAVDVLLATLRQFPEMVWDETAGEYGLEICPLPLRAVVPEPLRRRIPVRHVKRFSADLLPGGNTGLTIDISEAGLDHDARVISLNMLRPWLHSGIGYSYECRSTSKEAVVLSIHTNSAYAEFEVAYI